MASSIPPFVRTTPAWHGVPDPRCGIAQEIPQTYVVNGGEHIIDGVWWIMFYNEGTFESFKAMPQGLLYNGRKYGKMGWNSDTRSVSYREIPLAIAC